MTAQHWDQVFLTKDTHQVSWYQQNPETSLALIADTPGSVIDVGAGNSTLVDELLAAGRTELHRPRHLRGRARTDPDAGSRTAQSWSASRSLTSPPGQPRQTYEVWHDRAVFHFLTDSGRPVLLRRPGHPCDQPRRSSVVGTFAEDGPTQCSGPPPPARPSKAWPTVSQSASNSRGRPRIHQTPAGTGRPFTSVELRAVVVAVAVASPGDWDLDITHRAAAAQLTFGHGARYYIGAPLARTELQTVFSQFYPALPDHARWLYPSTS